MKKIIGCLLIFVSQTLLAENASDALQEKLNAMRTMSASFSQVVKAKKREISQSKGTMALSRPGRFRWQTKSPMEQVIVADGHKLWIYDVDLEQVTVKKQAKGIGGTAALFLSGYNESVAEDFDVTMHQKATRVAFNLVSKADKASFQRVTLVFDKAALKGITFYDQLGQRTEVTLRKIKTNVALPDTLFQFKAPKDVDVVEQ